MPSSTVRQRRLALLVLVVALVVAGSVVAWRQVDRLNEQFTSECALPDPQPCRDTKTSISSYPDLALDPRPAGRVVHIRFQPAPAMWATSVDPGFRAAQWSTVVTLTDGQAVVAACYYSSDAMVACEMTEEAWSPPPS
jgi:hypothetical protein